MLSDPMRSQSRALGVGIVVACLVLAGCAALALFRPQDKIGNADDRRRKGSGAMFVAVNDALHPVLNLASARLIVGEAAKPVTVSESEIESRQRGALVASRAPRRRPPPVRRTGSRGRCATPVTADGTGSVTTTVVVGEPSWSDRVGPARIRSCAARLARRRHLRCTTAVAHRSTCGTAQ
ncbi:hypothetical protein GS415_11890 [Rhodococcus hoagii]|nr:hypothetical protein [Prescottella equi]